MLQELLNLGLLDIGSDDSRYEKMQTAASNLATRFGEEPHLLIPATLLALDEDVDEDDPFFVIVEEIVVTEWKTLRNTHSNRPRQLLRSIAIDALATTSAESFAVSSIIWNIAAPLMRHKQIRLGKSAGLIEQLLARAFEMAEAEAIKRAGMSAPRAKRKTKKAAGDAPALNLTGKDVARAVGPSNVEGQALSDPNPQWTNNPPNWSYDFTPRMTSAVVKAVNLGTSRLAQCINKDLALHMASLQKHIVDELNAAEQLQVELEQVAAAGRLRLDVLWWSEARYSPFLKRGYRELTPPVLAIAAAADLAAIVPPLAPASVSYVLAEMVADTDRGARPSQLKFPLEDYLKSLAESSLNFGDRLPGQTSYDGRLPLLHILAESAAGVAISSATLKARTGIGPDLQLTPADLAVWAFGELQAMRMVETLS